MFSALKHDYEVLMQSQADSLIWLKNRVHVSPSAYGQKLLQESKRLLRSIQSELSRLHPVVFCGSDKICLNF